MSPCPYLGVQLVNTFPPYRVPPDFALHFCRISALPSCSFVCFHTAVSLPSHSHECRIESGLKSTISVHKNLQFYWKGSAILNAKECSGDQECRITNVFFFFKKGSNYQ
ncbi:hypothetical protein EUGRSUZ_H03693 [Eucalyptus grandis]|uniref:Uncharacterized protein n=2 Tax=Eucalyptus grandis TaxID=71139 RepID=A0ACC3JVW1_EUCGR|nr:hypothetical protein EUGRSUZ_H03693 [Eucalyptus grandis]